MALDIDLTESKTRIALVAAVLLGGSAIGVEMARWLSLRKAPVERGRRAGMFERESRPVSLAGMNFGQLARLLRPPALSGSLGKFVVDRSVRP